METESFAEEFTAAMDCRGTLAGSRAGKRLDLSGSSRLLDIAGGSGVYACAMAAQFAHLEPRRCWRSRRWIGSRPRAIAKRGFSDRVGVIPGDMLSEPLPRGYDVHLFSNVLHDWDEPVVEQLLQASAEALAPGGLLIVHEAFLNAQKDGPLNIAGVLRAADARDAGTMLLDRRNARTGSPRGVRGALRNSEWRRKERTRARRCR